MTFASDQQPGKITYSIEIEFRKKLKKPRLNLRMASFVEIGSGGPILYLSFTLCFFEKHVDCRGLPMLIYERVELNPCQLQYTELYCKVSVSHLSVRFSGLFGRNIGTFGNLRKLSFFVMNALVRRV